TGLGSYPIRVSVTDLAGNVGSDTQTITIDSSGWGKGPDIDNNLVISTDTGPDLGNSGVGSTGTGPDIGSPDTVDGQVMQQMAGSRLTHPLDLDQSPGSGQSGNPALVYNSDLTNVRPIVQTTVQLPSDGSALPATINAQLTWNGAAQTPVPFSTAGFSPG